MNLKKRNLVLKIMKDDNTFKKDDIWSGKCIHCKSKLYVTLEGQCLGKTSIEHIVPKKHGGDDDINNLALACKRCNNQKGVHLDNRNWEDPKLQKVINTLLERKMQRAK